MVEKKDEEYQIRDDLSPIVAIKPGTQHQVMNIPGKDVDFKTVGEDWITITLEDGSVLKFKIVISGIKRVPNNANGDPAYIIVQNNLVRLVKKTNIPFV